MTESGAIHKLYEALTSLRTGIFLLLAVGVVSLLGMFIVQMAPESVYQAKYGAVWGKLILLTGLDHVFSTPGFLLLILLSCANLIFCSLRRLGPVMRQAFARPIARDVPLLSKVEPVPLSLPTEEVLSEAGELLRRRGYSVDSRLDGGVGLLAARKGGISRTGHLITHIGMVLVLVGGGINGRFGFRIQRPLRIGQTLDVGAVVPSADFQVRIDDFEIETTPSGKIKDYKTTATVLQDGEESFSRIIEVNHPLVHEGVSFYQSSYGQETDRVRSVTLLYNQEPEETALTLPFGDPVTVPGTSREVKVTGFVPHFTKDLRTGEVYTRSDKPVLPAVQIVLLEDEETVAEGWLIKDMRAHGSKAELVPFHFVDYEPLFFTGIELANNPGIPILLAAFAINSIGIFFSFFIPFKQLWVRISPGRAVRSEIRVAGVSRWNQFAMNREIHAFSQALRREDMPDGGNRRA